MVVTRRSASPSLSEGSTVSVGATTNNGMAKKVVFAASVDKLEESRLAAPFVSATSSAVRRRHFPKPPKKIVKGTGHIHFHKKAPTVNKKGVGYSDNDLVQRVKLMTGTLYIYKGRKAEFVRTK